jgi:hypothetical protein
MPDNEQPQPSAPGDVDKRGAAELVTAGSAAITAATALYNTVRPTKPPQPPPPPQSPQIELPPRAERPDR